MAAYRCAECGTLWPERVGASFCVECQGPKGRLMFDKTAVPISEPEADARLAHARFNRYYEKDWKRVTDERRAELAREARAAVDQRLAALRELEAKFAA